MPYATAGQPCFYNVPEGTQYCLPGLLCTDTTTVNPSTRMFSPAFAAPSSVSDNHAASVGIPFVSTSTLTAAYAGKGYGALKTDLAEVMVEFVTPFRERTEQYLDDPETLDSILAKGAEKARAVAAETLSQAYDRVGFLHAKH